VDRGDDQILFAGPVLSEGRRNHNTVCGSCQHAQSQGDGAGERCPGCDRHEDQGAHGGDRRPPQQQVRQYAKDLQVFHVTERPEDQPGKDTQRHGDQPVSLSGGLPSDFCAVLQAIIPRREQHIIRRGFVTGNQGIPERLCLIIAPRQLVDCFQLLWIRFGHADVCVEFHVYVPFTQMGIDQQDRQRTQLTPHDPQRVRQVEARHVIELHLEDKQHLVGVGFAELERIQPQNPAVEGEQAVVKSAHHVPSGRCWRAVCTSVFIRAISVCSTSSPVRVI